MEQLTTFTRKSRVLKLYFSIRSIRLSTVMSRGGGGEVGERRGEGEGGVRPSPLSPCSGSAAMEESLGFRVSVDPPLSLPLPSLLLPPKTAKVDSTLEGRCTQASKNAPIINI